MSNSGSTMPYERPARLSIENPEGWFEEFEFLSTVWLRGLEPRRIR